jgi:hypothetical protein
MLTSNQLKSLQNTHAKKLSTTEWQKLLILTFFYECKSFPPFTFLGKFFCIVYNGFELSIYFAIYDTHIKIKKL